MSTRMTHLACALSVGLLLAGAVHASAQHCTTRWNSFLKQYDTHCSDGTRARERYNDFLHRSETTIQTPQGHTQQCTTTYTAFTRSSQTTCR